MTDGFHNPTHQSTEFTEVTLILSIRFMLIFRNFEYAELEYAILNSVALYRRIFTDERRRIFTDDFCKCDYPAVCIVYRVDDEKDELRLQKSSSSVDF
jgi:hypothetical protein